MSSNQEADRIVRLAEKAFRNTERSNVEEQWSTIAEFVLPNQSGIFNTDTNTYTPGAKRTVRLYDSTAIQANHDLAASIHATLTNPSTKWSKIRYKDDALNNDEEAVRWLDSVNNLIHQFFNESNFDTQVSKNYQSFTALGNMALLHEADVDETGRFEGFKFKAVHLSEIAYTENSKGIVDTVYRRFKLTARQAMEKWPDTVPDCIKECMEGNPEKEFKFYHVVAPRNKKDVDLGDTGIAPGNKRPFMSIYMEASEKVVVEETGFYEFPFYVTRWQTMPGEVYGRGPGHIALPDVRTLNRAKELGLHAIAKAINPPMIATQRNLLGSLDLRPGRLSVVRDLNGFKELVPQARFDVTQFAVEDLRQAIKQIFFLDKLLLPPRENTGEMTAFEVAQRLEQMQKVLGPTLSRLNSELLTPLIVRSFKILLRAGVLPEMPDIVKQEGIDVDIVFVNQLARSQQIEDVGNIQGWVQDIALLAQLRPEVIDNVDVDGIAKHTAKVRGVPEIAVTNDDEMEQIRQQRAEQQQMAQQVEMATRAADIQSKTDTGGE